ncbi:MAG: SEC-C domain-containing protein [Nitrospinae bacterium]|nr:SEC-C domain-containing protein [Nitrospinota bacterium]
MTSPGRNDLCPCGSGKKYKKCCLNRDYVPPGREELARKKAVNDLLGFCKRHYMAGIDSACARFWEDFNPEHFVSGVELEAADINFWEWLTYDWKPDGGKGKTLIDLYWEKKRILSQDELSMLKKMKEAALSLFEVQDVFVDQGLILKDLLLGGEYEVKEKSATHGLRRWDILACRILQTDGNFILSGSGYLYPMHEKDRLVRKIKSSFKKYEKEFPQAALRDFLKNEGHLFNRLWADFVKNPPKPQLVNTSGEPMVISKANYQIANQSALLEGLSALNDVEREDEGRFIWLDKTKDEERPTILATFTVSGTTLDVETNSRGRLKRARALIDNIPGGPVKHRADSFQDPYQAMESSREKPPGPGGTGIPPEVEEELIKKFLDKHYANWFDEKIPALNGKSPLEAVKTPAGKKEVIELLKLYENHEEKNRQQGKPVYDFAWMWERLNLKRE